MNEVDQNVEEPTSRTNSWPAWAAESKPHGFMHRKELATKFADWMEQYAKDLWYGNKGFALTSGEHEATLDTMLGIADTSSDRRILENWWVTLVTAGNREGIWKISLPSKQVPLPDVAPVFVPMDFQLLKHYRLLEKGIIRLVCGGLKPEQLRYAVLCSSVFFGGIASSLRFAALCALNASDITGNKDVLWATLKIPDGRNAIRSVRWYPDSLTTSLIVRLLKTGQWNVALAESGRPNGRLLDSLHRLGLGTWPEQWTEAELLRAAQVSLFLEHMGVVAGYLCDQFVSYSIPESVLHRIAGWKFAEKMPESEGSFVHKVPQDNIVTEHVPTFIPAVRNISQRELVRKITAILKENRQAHAKLSALQKEYGGGMWPIIYYLIEWAKWRVRPATGEGGILPVSVLRYFRPLAKSIIYEAEDEDILSFDVEDFETLYEITAASIKGENERAKVWATLRNFHDFMFLCGVPDIEFRELDGYSSDQSTGNVSANLITEAEFRQFKQVFFSNDQGKNSLTGERVFFAAMLGFRAGLRRREAQMLRMHDYHPGPEPLLLIRPSKFASLKSNSSNRRIPLKALLPSDEFNAFVSFMERRHSVLAGQQGFIFADFHTPTTPPSQARLIDPVTQAFYVICGSGRSNFCFHHLRHSFSNWLFLALLASDQHVLLSERPNFMDSDLLQEKHIQVIRDSLFPRLPGTPSAPDRRHLYQVAAFMGHLSPVTTLRSYLHLLDWIAARSLDISLENKLAGLEGPDLGRICGLSQSAPYKFPYRSFVNSPLRFMREFVRARGKFRKEQSQLQADISDTLQRIYDSLNVSTLPDIRLVITVIARRNANVNVDSLSRNFAVSPIAIEESYRAYLRMYAKQSVHHPKSQVPMPSAPRTRKDQSEFWRIIEETEKSLGSTENRQYLEVAAECLIRRNGPRSGRLYFAKRVQDAPNIARGILLMGIPPDQIKLVVRQVAFAEPVNQDLEKVVDAIRKCGIEIVLEQLGWERRSKKSDRIRLDISIYNSVDGECKRSEGRVRGLNYAALWIIFTKCVFHTTQR